MTNLQTSKLKLGINYLSCVPIGKSSPHYRPQTWQKILTFNRGTILTHYLQQH